MGVDSEIEPLWPRLPEATNGTINNRQTSLLDDIHFSHVPGRLLFAGKMVFVNTCFLITVVSGSRAAL
jgi:hypothetical protein